MAMSDLDKITLEDVRFLNDVGDLIVHLSEAAFGPKDPTDGHPRSLLVHRKNSERIKSIADRLERRLSV